MVSLFDRASRSKANADDRDINALCEALLEEKVEASIFNIAANIFDRYAELDEEAKVAFFHYLNDALDIDAKALAVAAQVYASSDSPDDYATLRTMAEAKRLKLFRRLNQIQGGTERLVKMRKDLLKIKRQHPALATTDKDFVDVFRSWFNRGFLVMREITWSSPATILEKIIEYEAVHEIKRWEELRRRLQPEDRRLFSFFHPAMPDEPLIFVEVALTKGIPNSIDSILSKKRTPMSDTEADTGVFYSISNCQPGLAGVSFGNSLIKQVVRELVLDTPQLTTFVTLSPIPGLMKWIKSENKEELIKDPENLKHLAAKYLLNAKDAKSKPVDPVARFHLGNGANVLAVHAQADSSDAAMARSGGAMVNYHYDLAEISQNQMDFENSNMVKASNEVKALANDAKKPAKKKR
jgi:malonyl-CoA decarboxylase